MSPMLDIQRRHAEVFRIRLGDRTSDNKPRKLTDSIRVTSPNLTVVAAFAEVFGGTPRPWDGGEGAQHEVYLPTTALPVMILPGESIQQWWELWKSKNESVCERRCDGFTETLSGRPCVCSLNDGGDPAVRVLTKGACRPMTRLSVICPDVAVIGAGSLVTHGMIAAETLPQSVQVAQAALSRGLMVPAIFRVIEHKGRKHYIVPQLEIVGVSLTEIATGDVEQPALNGVRAELAPPAPAAIEVGGGANAEEHAGDQRPDSDTAGSRPETDTPGTPPADAPSGPRRPATKPPLKPARSDATTDVAAVSARLNGIADSKRRSECVRQFKERFGPIDSLAADQLDAALAFVATFEASTPPAGQQTGGVGASPVETTATAAIGNGSTEAAAGGPDAPPAPSEQSAASATSNGKEDHAPDAAEEAVPDDHAASGAGSATVPPADRPITEKQAQGVHIDAATAAKTLGHVNGNGNGDPKWSEPVLDALILNVTGGRTSSAKELTAAEHGRLFGWLDDLVEGRVTAKVGSLGGVELSTQNETLRFVRTEQGQLALATPERTTA